MPVQQCFYYYCFVQCFQVGKYKSSTFCSSFQDCFRYFECLAIPHEFQKQLVNFYKEASWEPVRDFVEDMSILSLLIYEQEMFFHLFTSLEFLSEMFCSFQSVSFEFILLNLFIRILLFLMLLQIEMFSSLHFRFFTASMQKYNSLLCVDFISCIFADLHYQF